MDTSMHEVLRLTYHLTKFREWHIALWPHPLMLLTLAKVGKKHLSASRAKSLHMFALAFKRIIREVQFATQRTSAQCHLRRLFNGDNEIGNGEWITPKRQQPMITK